MMLVFTHLDPRFKVAVHMCVNIFFNGFGFVRRIKGNSDGTTILMEWWVVPYEIRAVGYCCCYRSYSYSSD